MENVQQTDLNIVVPCSLLSHGIIPPPAPHLVEMRFSREQTPAGIEAPGMGSTAGTRGQGGGGGGLNVPLSLRREEMPAW